jgi:eukaryotic-like serine/threonine-protein kinase
MVAPSVREALDGRYRLESRIGGGASGQVFRAQRLLGAEASLCAIKVVQLPDEGSRRRFAREVRTLQAVNSPYVVRLIEYLEPLDQEWAVIVTELLHGRSLAEELLLRPLQSARSVAQMMLGIGLGLAAAHRAGVVHRDIKPANVFLCANLDAELSSDQVRLIDFGFAKPTVNWHAHFSALTRSGVIVGTPRYMAPEQIFDDAEADHRVDFWALGVLAYHALTGKFPIEAESLGHLIQAFSKNRVIPLRKRAVEASAPLVLLVDSMLQLEPAKRPQSAEQVEQALRAIPELAA